jgi:hypothetical protein
MIEPAVCFFTCVTNGYDKLDHLRDFSNGEFCLNIIADSRHFEYLDDGKNIKLHFVENNFTSNILYNRWYKFFPFEILPSYQLYVYLDANSVIDFVKLKKFLQYNDLSDFNTFYHPSGRNLFEEAVYNLTISKIDVHTFKKFNSQFLFKKYYDNKISENCFLIFRRFYISRSLADSFFKDVFLYKRDQLILIPFLIENKVDYTFFNSSFRDFYTRIDHVKTNALPFLFQIVYPFYSKCKFRFYKWFVKL